MKQVVLATNNNDKKAEMQYLLSPFGIEVLTLNDLNIKIDVDETGKDYQENALIKAKAIYDIVKRPVIADDSGLEIEALDNQPGVHSARFMEGYSYKEKCAALLELIKDSPNRRARFICVIGLVADDKQYHFTGISNGRIADYISEKPGFGYDIFFIPTPTNQLFSEMELKEKNSYSHRSKAVIKLIDFLFDNEEVFNQF